MDRGLRVRIWSVRPSRNNTIIMGVRGRVDMVGGVSQCIPGSQ